MRFFITGANGQLAKSFVDLSPDAEVYLATKSKLDITNRKEVLRQISDFKPDIVFHFASMTRGDECAKYPEEAYKINVLGTKYVVEACKKVKAALVFVSTNEIFDGKAKTPYRENQTPNPITVVGKTKFDAENIIKKNMKNYYIVRTMWLYSMWSSNFLHAVLKKVLRDKKIDLVEDEMGSPTSSFDLAKALKDLIATNKYGTYHLTNEGVTSRLEFGKKVFAAYKIKDITITSVKLENFKRLSKPPAYSPLKNVKAKKLGIILPPWERSLKKFLSENNLLQHLN